MYLCQAPKLKSAQVLASPAHLIWWNLEMIGEQRGIRKGKGDDDAVLSASYSIKVAHLLNKTSSACEFV